MPPANGPDGKPLRPIVIKKIKKKGHAAHGGAWKIAFADFMTAMMAFFLLMWLLGSTTEGEKKGIAEYFANPLKASMSGGSGAGDATSVIKGGGTDLTQSVGQVAKGEGARPRKGVAEEVAAADKKRLQELQDKLQVLISTNANLAAFSENILLDTTNEGLRIQIVDDKNRPMFDVSASTMKDYTRVILQELAPALNDVPNRITISGHTDSLPFAAGEAGYGNWELSSERANSARRELVHSGLDPSKVIQVRGLADAIPLRPDPLNPENRRISITLLTKTAELALEEATAEPEAAAPESSPASSEPPAPPEPVLSPLEKALKEVAAGSPPG